MTENDLLLELERELVVPKIDPDEVTVSMLAQRMDIPERTALDHLRKKVAKKELASRYVINMEGHRVLAFRKLEQIN